MARWNALSEDTAPLVETMRKIALPLEDNDSLDPLIQQIGDARIVMLGEATHGTSEFYTWRARLSERLIREKGFNFIAVEGDWPDCYRINRYIKGYPNAEESAFKVLNAFERWPTWMWANWEVAALAEWLKRYNAQTKARKAGFYGLDVYSLFESMHAIVTYLEKKDPHLAQLARKAYHCFEPYAEDVQAYAWSTRMTPESCENEIIELLREMHQRPSGFDHDEEAAFNAEQNALVLVDAERYYRAMVRSDQNSWNVRDVHMADTLERLLRVNGPGSRAIVWAHNTHVGDARYTDMVSSGMTNLGQIARERWGEAQVFLVGSGTHHGTVIAGKEWDEPMQVMGVPDAVERSWEDVLHQVGQNDLLLLLRDYRQKAAPGTGGDRVAEERGRMTEERSRVAEERGRMTEERGRMTEERGHRAIGVVYNPEFERFGNYVPTRLPLRYDAFMFIDATSALHPMHIEKEVEPAIPETYPWGL